MHRVDLGIARAAGAAALAVAAALALGGAAEPHPGARSQPAGDPYPRPTEPLVTPMPTER